jgi:hypothetical protein
MIKSEQFQNSYCIFVHDASYKNHLQGSVKLLKADFDDNLYCIVIPNSMNVKAIEAELFNLPYSKKGFWGQFGMGYLGKTWSLV